VNDTPGTGARRWRRETRASSISHSRSPPPLPEVEVEEAPVGVRVGLGGGNRTATDIFSMRCFGFAVAALEKAGILKLKFRVCGQR
jgi:hypothetical protein